MTSLIFSATPTTIGEVRFTPNAPAYDFSLCVCDEFRLVGAGIVNDSSNAPTFNNAGGLLSFNNRSTAGNAAVNSTGGLVEFNNFSTAGNAALNNLDGQIDFKNRSTAGNSTIVNDTSGFSGVTFANQSGAGTARITNSSAGVLQFADRSSAENALITNNDAGSVIFSNRSSAGNATIINNSFFPVGAVGFFNQSTAENATLITSPGSATLFFDRSTGANAQFITAAGGVVDFSGTGGPDNAGKISAGSIAGAGDYFLGSNELTVGSNNLSTVVSGTINDGGLCGCATNASLVKTGSATLTLLGINGYTGPTTVNAGSLIVNGSIALSVSHCESGGTIGGTGILPNTFISGGALAPGNSIGTLTI